MLTAIVQFSLREAWRLEQAQAIFSATAPKYREMPGLISKHYVLSLDGKTAGGVYLWQTLEDAQRCYSDEWRAFVRDKYGVEPVISLFASPVVVDNVQGVTIIHA